MPTQTKEEHIKLLNSPIQTPDQQCPYLADEVQSLTVFWATNIDASDTQNLLSSGWRKFGQMNFKPSCSNCQKCTPLRVRIKDFLPSKSQRKILNRNKDIEVKFLDLEYKNEYYSLYRKHSKDRFNQETITSEEEFKRNFFEFTGQQFLSVFYLEEKIIAFGLLEKATDSVSSAYFVYDPAYSSRNLGTFGVVCEINYAKDLGLDYYYLGYWINECKALSYKSNFRPYEVYGWKEKKWTLAPDIPKS